MRFLVDECVGPAVAHWLRELGHDVVSIYEIARGITDTEVFRRALEENRILITLDKDFGEKINREKHSHKGVILLRLNDERAPNKIDVLQRLIVQYSDRLQDNFIVVSERTVRFVQKR
jgi:predicted nuclease of predicted toxin-antitoxin system